MTFFTHVLEAMGYIMGRQYGAMFAVAGCAIALIYMAIYFLTRGAR